MSTPSASKARRSLTEQFELLYPNNPNSARTSTRHIDSHHTTSPQRQLGRYSGGSVSSTADGINSLAFLHETLRNHGTELELERRTREAAVRDLSARTSVEIGELREMIKQLRQENGTLKESLWALERRKVPMIAGAEGALTAEHYFGGAAALAHVQLPLIPRVTDLETALEQLRQKVTKLQGVEKSREESLQKALVELQIQQRSTLDQAKEFTRFECDRREASRLDPLEQQLREMAAAHQDAQRQHVKSLADTNSQLALFGDRIRATENALADAQHDRQSQQHLEEWKRTMRTAAEVEAEKVRSMVADLKADLSKAIRKQEAGDIEVQDALQTFVSQKVDVVRAEMLPREEMAKLNNTVSSAQRDVDRATTLAQTAKVSAEETKRELMNRVAALEAEESSVMAKMGQLSSEVTTVSQATRAAAGSLEELRAALKANQTATSDNSERITATNTKLIEQAGSIDSITQDLARAKVAQSSATTLESSERQQLKERLYVAEDEVKTLKSKLAALEDTQSATKKETDRALGDLRSAVAAEERAGALQAQQKLTTSLLTLEARVSAVDDRVGIHETSTQKLREDLLTALRTKVEDAKETIGAKLEGVEENSKSRDKDLKEAVARTEEKLVAAVSKLKTMEGAMDGLATHNDLEKAIMEAKEAQSKALSRQMQELAKDSNALRDDLTQLRATSEKAIVDLAAEMKAKSQEAASRTVVEELRSRLEDVAAISEQSEASMASNIHKAVRDRVKPLQDAQNNQKEEFEEFQSLVSELAQRLKDVVSSVDKHSNALSDQDKAIEAVEKSSASILNELMMAVSVACSHDQQFGSASHSDGAAPSSALG